MYIQRVTQKLIYIYKYGSHILATQRKIDNTPLGEAHRANRVFLQEELHLSSHHPFL